MSPFNPYKPFTVELPVSEHHRDPKKCPLRRGVHLWEVKNVMFMQLRTRLSVRLREVSTYGRCPLAEVQLYYTDHRVFYWKIHTRKNHARLQPGPEWRTFHILLSENIDDIIPLFHGCLCKQSVRWRAWLEDMNFIFSC